MLLFCMGGVCSGTTEVDDEIGEGRGSRIGVAAKRSYAYLEASSLGGYVRVLLGCGFIGYGLWFLFLGMDDMHNAFPHDCNYAFFLTRVDLFGWFRTFLKVLFVCATIPAVLSLVFMTISLVSASWVFLLEGGWKGRVKHHKRSASSLEGENVAPSKGKQSASSEGEGLRVSEGETAPSEEEKEVEKPGLQIMKLRKQNVGFSGALLLFVLSVELIIRWNKIEGVGAVGSTGQLFPVIIGVGGIGRVVIRFIQDSLEELALTRERKMSNREPRSGFGVRLEDLPGRSHSTGAGSMTNNPASTQPTGNELDNQPSNPPFVHDISGFPR